MYVLSICIFHFVLKPSLLLLLRKIILSLSEYYLGNSKMNKWKCQNFFHNCVTCTMSSCFCHMWFCHKVSNGSFSRFCIDFSSSFSSIIHFHHTLVYHTVPLKSKSSCFRWKCGSRTEEQSLKGLKPMTNWNKRTNLQVQTTDVKKIWM